jgi:hypothetical protein
MSRELTLFFVSFASLLLAGCGQVDSAKTESAKTPAATASENPLQGKIVDLTHAFGADTIYWPTEKGFQFDRGNNGVTAKGYYYAANRFTTAEHGGTHLDAPIHFAADKPPPIRCRSIASLVKPWWLMSRPLASKIPTIS